MEKRRRKLKIAFWAALSFVLVFVTIKFADATSVRVAYFDCGEYFKQKSDGNIDSYDAAYLQAIADRSDLTFEYVDCGTWENALRMLAERKIDLLGTMQKNANRQEQYALSENSYGVTAAELVTLPKSRIGYKDYAAIGTARLGVLRGYARQQELDSLLLRHALKPKIFYYDTQKALFAALLNGNVDVIATHSHTIPTE